MYILKKYEWHGWIAIKNIILERNRQKPTKTDKNDPHGFKDFGKKLGYTIWSINGVPSVLQKENLEDKNSCSSYDYMEESIFWTIGIKC